MTVTRLSLSELARRLHLPPTTVERWIRQGRMPVRQRGDHCVYDEQQLASWARESKLDLQVEGDDRATGGPSAEDPVLIDCLRRGGVHHDLRSDDAATALAAAAAVAPVPDEDREELATRLLEREALASTGIGNGIAFPHPRSPLTDMVTLPSVTTCFLAEAVDRGAVDGRPVEVMFLVLSPSTKVHLRLLAQLAYRVRDREFQGLLAERPPAARFLAEADRLQGANPGRS